MKEPQAPATGDRDVTREQSSCSLDERIAMNKSGATDLNTWIFSHLGLKSEDHVLELCAGTGYQSLRFLESLKKGRLVATDIATDSLKALEEHGEGKGNLTTICADMDDLEFEEKFNLIFCAYGLYYSKDPTALLEKMCGWLRPNGRIAIVGPYGPNNDSLFSLLRSAGVTISDYVRYTSQTFMEDTAKPWAHDKGLDVRTHTLVNPVVWSNTEDVLRYWRHSVFYDVQYETQVRTLLDQHIATHGVFRNEKHIMFLEISLPSS